MMRKRPETALADAVTRAVHEGYKTLRHTGQRALHVYRQSDEAYIGVIEITKVETVYNVDLERILRNRPKDML